MKRRSALLSSILAVTLCGGCGVWLHVQRQQYIRNRQLIAALVHLDINQALALVNAGADPNTHFRPSPPPSFKGLLDRFLPHKPSPADHNPTAFLFACGAGCEMAASDCCGPPNHPDTLPLVQAMFVHGVNLNAQTSDKETALHEATFTKQARVVEWLLEHGANVNAQDNLRMTPLMEAVEYDQQNIVRLLLAHGAAVNLVDTSGRTALHLAMLSNMNKDIIQQLLTYGADPNQPDKRGETPLMRVQWAHRPDMVALMQKNGK